MEIRTNLNKMNISGSINVTKPKFDNAAVIDTNDSVSKAEMSDTSFKKPEIKTEKSGEVRNSGDVKPEPGSSLITGAETIPGAAASVVKVQLQKLEKTGVQFMEKRLIPTPFFKHKAIDTDRAASILTSGNKSKIGRLRVKTDNTDPVPITNLNDIGELSGFKGIGAMPSSEKDMSDFIGYAGKIGLEFKTDDSNNVGEYGAYNLLTTGWGIAGQSPKPVQLVRDGVSLMTIKPGDRRSDKELRQELDTAWKAMEKIKELNAKTGVYKALNKPLFDLSFVEKYNAMDVMDFYSGRALSKYNFITKHAQNKDEFNEIVDILKGQTKDVFDNSEFDSDHVQLLMKRDLPSDLSPREKSEVMRDIRKNKPRIDDTPSYITDSFKYLRKKSGNGEEFRNNAKTFCEMVSAMRDNNRTHFDNTNAMSAPKKAFEFITEQLNGNKEDVNAFIGLLRGSSVDEAKTRFQALQTPVKTEDLQTRIKTSHELLGTERFDENYKIVLENLGPGENPTGMVKLVKSLRVFFKDDSPNLRKQLLEVKSLASGANGSLEKCSEVLDKMHYDLDMGMEALKTIAKPAGSLNFSEKADSFKAIRDIYPESASYRDYLERNEKNAIEDYSTVVKGKFMGETLQEATNRFIMLFNNLGGSKSIENVRSSYTLVSREMKEGNTVLSNDVIQKALLQGKNLIEVGKILSEEAGEDTTQSKGQPTGQNNRIEQDDEKVIIGGVKLSKKKYENILRIFDQSKS